MNTDQYNNKASLILLKGFLIEEICIPVEMTRSVIVKPFSVLFPVILEIMKQGNTQRSS